MIATKSYAIDPRTYHKIYLAINADKRKKHKILIFIAVLGVAGLSVYTQLKYGVGFEVLKSWLPFLGLLFVWYWFLFWFFPKSFFRNKQNRNCFSKRVHRFYEDRLEMESDDGSVRITPYTSFAKYKIGSNYFAFWESSLLAYEIPFAAFESEEDANRAADHVKRALDER